MGSTFLGRALQGSSARRLSPLVSYLLLVPMAAVLLFAFYIPIIRLLSRSVYDGSFTTQNYSQLLDHPIYALILIRTVRTAAIVALVTLILGYPVAYAMARLGGVRANLIAVIVTLPLWTSVLVRSFAWTVLLDQKGVVNAMLLSIGVIQEPVKLLYTEGAVWLGMIHILLPFMVLPVYGNLRGVPPDLARAARNLGAGNFSVFRHVILPLSVPGVAAGSMIVFILSLGFFVTPALLGGPTTLMVSTLISQLATMLLDWPFAGALATVLLGATLLIVLAFNRFLKVDRMLGDVG